MTGRLCALLVAALVATACEQRTVRPRRTVTPGRAVARSAPARPVPGGLPSFGHVFIIVEENADYADVIGDTTMPYLNDLARQYGLATRFYGNAHPSIGNYFMLAVGDTVTNDDGFSDMVEADNVLRALGAAGKTWKSYAEDLPQVGYVGPGRRRYARKHNVFALLTDVVHDSAQARNLVPFPQLATDLAGNTLPDYGFIVPNLCNDAHDCPLRIADEWLKRNIDPLVRSPAFQRDGLLIIVFDESRADNLHGGGLIPCVIVSPKAKPGYQSKTLYQHQSLLRLSLEALGVQAFPNGAARAPDMDEFFALPRDLHRKRRTPAVARAQVRSAGGTSRSNQNWVPQPGRVSRYSSEPMARTRRRVSASPRPVPEKR